MALRKSSRKPSKKKAAARKRTGSWGGRRQGAGRPMGSGQGPSPNSRRNRVAVMLNDTELAVLAKLSKAKGRPVSTQAYELLARALKR